MNGQRTVQSCSFCEEWQIDYTLEDLISYVPVNRIFGDEPVRALSYEAMAPIEKAIQEHVRTAHPDEWRRINEERRLIW